MVISLQWVASSHGEVGQFSLPTPAGDLLVEYQGDVIIATDWLLDNAKQTTPPPFAQQLQAALEDTSVTVNIKLLQQGTPFRQRVWNELCQIPFGTTLTYTALAHKVGSAARAVGNACRDNPYAYLIPCHRVVAANGLGGYCGKTTGEFMDIKTKLLMHETNNATK